MKKLNLFVIRPSDTREEVQKICGISQTTRHQDY